MKKRVCIFVGNVTGTLIIYFHFQKHLINLFLALFLMPKPYTYLCTIYYISMKFMAMSIER